VKKFEDMEIFHKAASRKTLITEGFRRNAQPAFFSSAGSAMAAGSTKMPPPPLGVQLSAIVTIKDASPIGLCGYFPFPKPNAALTVARTRC
jgi:hypothetical protein